MSERNPSIQTIFGEGTPRIIRILDRPSGWIVSNTADDGTSLTVICRREHGLNPGDQLRFDVESDLGELTGDVTILTTPTTKTFTCHIASTGADTGGHFMSLVDIYESTTGTTYSEDGVVLNDLMPYGKIRLGQRIAAIRTNPVSSILQESFGKITDIILGSDDFTLKQLRNVTGSGPGNRYPTKFIYFGGHFWVTCENIDKVFKLDTNGNIVYEYSGYFNRPKGITNDGTDIWVANFGSNSVTKITVSTHAMTNYSGTGSGPFGICFDGTYIWTANFTGHSVSKITLAGSITNYSGGSLAYPIAIASDGTNVWTANYYTDSVSKITTGGDISTYSGTGVRPIGIVYDGTYMWTCNELSNNVSRIEADGTITSPYGLGIMPSAIYYYGGYLWSANFGTVDLSGEISCSVTKLNVSTGAMLTYSVPSHVSDILFDNTNSYVWFLMLFNRSIGGYALGKTSVRVDSWSMGVPDNGEKFKIDGWVCDLPCCQKMVETFEPDQLVHELYRGDEGSEEETEMRGYKYQCVLNYAKYLSAEALYGLNKILGYKKKDQLILIPRRDNLKYIYRVYLSEPFDVSKYGRTAGYSGLVFVFKGKSNIATVMSAWNHDLDSYW